jgi:hypothetical protein
MTDDSPKPPSKPLFEDYWSIKNRDPQPDQAGSGFAKKCIAGAEKGLICIQNNVDQFT